MSLFSKKSLVTATLLGAVGMTTVGCNDSYNPYPSPIEKGDSDEAATQALAGLGQAVSLPDNPVPQHPYLAADGRNGTHADAYSSGTYKQAGPVGNNTLVRSAAPVDFWQGFVLAGECLTPTYS